MGSQSPHAESLTSGKWLLLVHPVIISTTVIRPKLAYQGWCGLRGLAQQEWYCNQRAEDSTVHGVHEEVACRKDHNLEERHEM